jgi:hypothetical protein
LSFIFADNWFSWYSAGPLWVEQFSSYLDEFFYFSLRFVRSHLWPLPGWRHILL